MRNSFAGPEEWRSQEFGDYGQFVTITDEIIDQVDVLMLLRVQHERHDSGAVFSKEDYHAQHGLNQERYNRLKNSNHYASCSSESRCGNC